MSRSRSALALCALALVGFLATPAHAQYALRANVVAAGATDATGGSYRVRATVGQPAVGRVAGGSNAVGQGFWYPATLGGGASGPALSVTATPLNPPITIPPGGGELRYRVTIHNNTGTAQSFQAWIDVTLPNGNPYPVLGPKNLSLGPNQTLGPVTLTQRIPASAPAGTYAYNVYVGTFPGTVVDSDSFPFTKSAAPLVAPLASRSEGAAVRAASSARTASSARLADDARTAAVAARAGAAGRAARRMADWPVFVAATGAPVGEDADFLAAIPIDPAAEARFDAEEAAARASREAAEAERAARETEEAAVEAAIEVAPVAPRATAAALPAEATLAPPFPNPGAHTTLRFGLPEAGPVRLAVYDLTGRRVALLVDGTREAGWHEVPFHEPALAGGVYLVRFETAGRVLTQRFTLLR